MSKNPRQSGPRAQPPTPTPPRRSLTPVLAFTATVLVLVVAAFWYVRANQPPPQAQTASAAKPEPPAPVQAAAAQATVPPANARFGPHKQQTLPALPFSVSAPARPPEVVRAVYKFSAEHPEILGYVPCYCGCERSGHRGNDDCFVASRAANGDVTEWEPHGMT